MTPFQTNPTAVRLEGVSKSFGETKALIDANFDGQFGEIHAIVGENGSGKSTLAKIMSGVIHADTGSINVGGGTPTSPREARALRIATIFQEVLVADDASVLDNLFVGHDGFWLKKLTKTEKARQAREMMKKFSGVDIDPLTLVSDLPLNIKQWIVICRAFLTRPKILILDESSAALDLDATVRLHDAMAELRDSGSCIIIVTHRIAELVKIADRATILRDGKTVGLLEKQEITEDNLLALMTPHERGVTSAQHDRQKLADKTSAPVLHAREVALLTHSKTFSFAVGSGEIVGIAGLDGHGQELFIRLVAGILPPVSGGVEVASKAGPVKPLRNQADADVLGIAYVSGDRKREGIFPDLSIYENLAVALYRRNANAFGWINRKPIEDSFGIECRRLSVRMGSKANKITSLSGGNQQKILIGRAFALSPQLIVLNDPARGVDLNTKRDLYIELRRFADQGGSVIYLSSEIEEFIGFANRVDVFHNGSIFRSLADDNIAEDEMLAAMFGQTGTVSFESHNASEAVA